MSLRLVSSKESPVQDAGMKSPPMRLASDTDTHRLLGIWTDLCTPGDEQLFGGCGPEDRALIVNARRAAFGAYRSLPQI
jgi:hypothetical protein